jgi:hypothetical protein
MAFTPRLSISKTSSKRLFVTIILTFLLCSFNASTARNKILSSKTVSLMAISKETIKELRNDDSIKVAFKKNIDFFARVLLKRHGAVIRNYIRKYQPNTCAVIAYKNSALKEDFEEPKAIKSLYGNKRNDTVIVIPPFNHCDDGDSYCFYDRKLPRLQTDSYCCHPKSLFVLPDIDEDGVKEIGIYYSSCSSRFKALIIYSLKHGEWKEIASSTFDTFMKDPDKVQFATLVKKISRGKFKICDFADGKTKWEAITMK